ncbi:uncharacterized protein LOC122247475 isoform X2 [Penaeus japonicus]|uniref:uncharacterized protein LOC122247475 isoform X2 n=1 Tax=Penaeus japonicus TaxID=27405 RepID=UPI001C710295|nr:uncharacterized protein LOC122247475 isoform X2 [Penaeus japonicus]
MKFVVLLALIGLASCRTFLWGDDDDDNDFDIKYTFDDDDFEDLPSAFAPRGSPLAYSYASSLALPTAVESLGALRARSFSLPSAFASTGPLATSYSASFVLPSRVEVVEDVFPLDSAEDE